MYNLRQAVTAFQGNRTHFPIGYRHVHLHVSAPEDSNTGGSRPNAASAPPQLEGLGQTRPTVPDAPASRLIQQRKKAGEMFAKTTRFKTLLSNFHRIHHQPVTRLPVPDGEKGEKGVK